MQINGFFRKWRIYIAGTLAVLVTLYVFAGYVKLSFGQQKEFTVRTPVVERGSIVDRNGKPLAVQTTFYHFGVSPRMIKDPAEFAAKVSSVLGISATDIAAKITGNEKSSFIYIKKKITQETYDELYSIIRQNKYTAFSRFDRIPGRVYPENDLAAQLIGYMGDEGEGLSGIEYAWDHVLSPELEEGASKDIYGQNIYLTIDAALQYSLEKIAKATMQTTQAESMMLIAADAKNGEILSYISLPSMNLNDFVSADKEATVDRPAASVYEPGSVFKVFTAAACIDTGVLNKDTLFLCDGVYERTTKLGDHIKITCLDHHGWVSVREALKYSCNDAFAQMSDLLDTDTFLSYVHKFGFGTRTGIELPTEAAGSVKEKTDRLWSARSKPTMAMGQEISVNALQMVQAATAITNGGVPVKLTVIRRTTDKDGNETYAHQPAYGDRILKASTAKYILSCMKTTAESGTGMRAQVDGVTIGVKTGTAQMADLVNGGYSQTDFLSNCLAVFPAEDPEIILYIVIQKAKGETYAGRIVAPVISEAAEEIINQRGMNSQRAATFEHSGHITITSGTPITIDGVVPDFTGRPKRDLLPLLVDGSISLSIHGEGWVTSQVPEPGTPITENMTIELYLE